MPVSRKINRQRVKTHRSYTVDEAARTLGVGKPTVRRWIKGGGLPALTDRKPWLIPGGDLADLWKTSRTPRQKCHPDECFCVKCRKPQKPAAAMVEFIPLTPTGDNLRAICPDCEKIMHKRVNRAALSALSELLEVTIAQEPQHLIDSANPSVNVNLRWEPEAMRKFHPKNVFDRSDGRRWPASRMSAQLVIRRMDCAL
jgi:excisionase family DNA binding protein